MGDEFYSVIKLVTNEEIFSLVSIDDNDGDPIILLQNPVVMKIIQGHNRSMVKIKPWMEIPEDDIFVINLDKVITMTEIKTESLINLYNQYISDSNNDNTFIVDENKGKVNITSNMGFISTVEDARKTLENLYNTEEDTKES